MLLFFCWLRHNIKKLLHNRDANTILRHSSQYFDFLYALRPTFSRSSRSISLSSTSYYYAMFAPRGYMFVCYLTSRISPVKIKSRRKKRKIHEITDVRATACLCGCSVTRDEMKKKLSVVVVCLLRARLDYVISVWRGDVYDDDLGGGHFNTHTGARTQH